MVAQAGRLCHKSGRMVVENETNGFKRSFDPIVRISFHSPRSTPVFWFFVIPPPPALLMPPFRLALILVAAGRSMRFGDGGEGGGGDGGEGGGDGNKVERLLAGRPVFMHALDRFADRPEVVRILLAVRPDEVEAFTHRHRESLASRHVQVVPGGEVERWQTVQRALGWVAEMAEVSHVVVHDAARPLTPRGVIDRVWDAARRHAAVIPGVPVADTLKRVEGGVVTATISRAGLVAVQTPQVFRLDLLRRAYAPLEGMDPAAAPAVTDDAGLVEALGEPVRVVAGSRLNLKITIPDDLRLAERLLR